MKSAYELAMERLQKDSPARKITERQKTELAEIDALAKAKAAEREVFLKDQIAKAAAAGKYEEVEQIPDELSRDLRRIQADCEARKEKVREQKA
jgi:hypothetical protein